MQYWGGGGGSATLIASERPSIAGPALQIPSRGTVRQLPVDVIGFTGIGR